MVTKTEFIKAHAKEPYKEEVVRFIAEILYDARNDQDAV